MPPWLPSSSIPYFWSPKITTISPSTLLHPRHPPHRRLLPTTPVRLASQRRPRRPQYNQPGNAQILYSLWKTFPHLRYGVGAVALAGGGFYYYKLEEVPISGRRRFNCVSAAREEARAEPAYRRVMQQYGRDILPPDHPDSQMVSEVMARLISAAGLESQNWEVKVIDDEDVMNAFVFPGNKVFVFSGILDICADEDGLAAVLGHEIAHNIAHHNAEKLSQWYFLTGFAELLTVVFDLQDGLAQFILSIALERPGSREMEAEADHIGLLMMAQACYDPRAAVGLWERMSKEETHAPPQILSTHPAGKNRLKAIQELLPQAQQKRAESPCGSTAAHMDEFSRELGHEDDEFW